MRIIFLFSISLPPSLSSPHQLDIAEGGRIGGVVNQQEGISSAEPEVRIVEPLLLAGGREDGDGWEVHHPTLQSNYHLSPFSQLQTNSVAKISQLSLYLDY